MSLPTMRNILRDRGGFISVTQHDTAGAIDHIPAHVYDVGFNPDIGLMLIRDRQKFTVPERKYGKHRQWFNAVTSRYDRQNPSMGVLMCGFKGTGKSMLSEDFCNWGLKQDLPVLFINQKLPAQLIHSAVSSIGPCIVYFDEFGKSYRASDENSENDRDKMITLFSDTSHRGVLFIVTGNHKHEFSDFMLDRPGRFEFRFNFNTLDVSVAAEIADEYKLTPIMRDFLLRHTEHRQSSFDIAIKLATILRRHKTLDEAVEELEIINIPEPVWYGYRVMEVWYRGKRHSQKHLSVTTAKGKDDVLNIVIRDETYQELDNVSVDTMAPTAKLITASKPSEIEYLPLGRYSIKVHEDLTIVFDRYTAGARYHVNCHALSEQDELDAAESQRLQEEVRNAARGGGANFPVTKVPAGRRSTAT